MIYYLSFTEGSKEQKDMRYDLIERNIKEIHTLKAQRDTLLSKLVSGEVRVKGFG